MKIIANVKPVIQFLFSLRPQKVHMKAIRAARASGDLEEERRCILNATSSWGTDIMRRLGSRIHVYGEENIPEEGPVVMVGNHQGYADIFTYFAVFHKYQFAFVAKQELSKLPFFGKFITEIRSVLIDRDNKRGQLDAITEGIELIEQGFSLVIFPEGTRSLGGDPHPFMRGSLKLATKPGVPIVPVSIEGTYKMMEQDGYFHGADVYIKIHEPIPTAGISRKEEKELAAHLEKLILDGVEELRQIEA